MRPNRRYNAQHNKRHNEAITSSAITPEDRMLRVKVALKQIDFYENLQKTLDNPNWTGRNHPYLDLYPMSNLAIDVALAAKFHRDELADELKILNIAIGQDRGETDDGDETA